MEIEICGIAELASLRGPFSHVLAIIEPHLAAGLPELASPAKSRLVLTCDDVEWPTPFGSRSGGPPSEEMVQKALAFARALTSQDRLLIHCRHGISRSTAMAFVILCDLHPSLPEDEILKKVIALRPSAFPNALIVAHGDKILQRKGRMIAALEHYRSDPESFVTSTRALD